MPSSGDVLHVQAGTLFTSFVPHLSPVGTQSCLQQPPFYNMSTTVGSAVPMCAWCSGLHSEEKGLTRE